MLHAACAGSAREGDDEEEAYAVVLKVVIQNVEGSVTVGPMTDGGGEHAVWRGKSLLFWQF